MKIGILYFQQPIEDAYKALYAKRQRNRDEMTAILKGKTPLRQMALKKLN